MRSSRSRVPTSIALAVLLTGCTTAGASRVESPTPIATQTPTQTATHTAPTPTSAAPTPSATPGPRLPGWTATEAMVKPRESHTATLLLDGTVLVAGGISGDLVAEAELFDPTSGTWTTAGEMLGPRYNHTATLLGDGRVLVAGGTDTASAELYDPTSRSWSPAGEMASIRSLATATLLPDGQVLLTGGSDSSSHGGWLASAELYDPISGTWNATGSMATARYGHTATMLPDGTVLVAGGFEGESTPIDTGASASAERYDPSTASWAPTGSMTDGRAKHTATLLLDGTVLVTPLGGSGSAERFDLETGRWSVTGDMETIRFVPVAVLLLSGDVLVAGGYDEAIEASAELYSPGAGAWTPTASMIEGRSDHTATRLLDGRVLVVGGNGADPTSAELYDAGDEH